MAARRTLLASAVVILLGTASAFAQSGSTSGSSSSTSGADTSRRGQSGTTSGSTGSYDTGSTTGASRADTSPSSTRSGTTGTTGSSATAGRDTAGDSEKLSWGDRRFVNKAADEGMAELELAKLAAQRATNPEVKQYAQKLVTEHTKVNSELMSLASQKNVKVDQDDAKDRAYKRLNKASGSEFDQEFVEHMVEAHEKDVKMYEKAAEDAKDPAVRSFASKHVSSLRQHLQEAQSLQQSVMPTGRTDDRSGRSTPGGTSDSSLGTSSTDSSSSTSPDSTGSQRGGASGASSSGTSSGSSGTSSGASSTSDDSSTPPR